MLRRLSARIVLWQAATAAALAGPASATGRAAAALAAAAVVTGTAVPVGGRTGDQWLAARVRFRRRMRRRARTATALESVIPGIETRGHADRAGNRVGLVADGPAWTAVLRLDPFRETELVPRLTELIEQLASIVAVGERPTDRQVHRVRAAAVQLVGWAVPATGPAQGRATAMRTYWVAVRFEPSADPNAVRSRGGGEQGEVRAAAVAALRLAARLRSHGYGLRVLAGVELTDELGTSLGLTPPPRAGDGAPVAPSPPPPVRERWRAWSLGPLQHACFRLRRPPRSARTLAAALAVAPRPPAITTCVSVRFTPPDDTQPQPRGEVVIRVAAPGRASGAVRRRTVGLPRLLRVVPMHGQHLVGVRATIPLARGLDDD